jgi:hypothetical protein
MARSSHGRSGASTTVRRGKGGGIELDTELYHEVVTFRAGKMVRIRYFGEWPEALEVAGLRE